MILHRLKKNNKAIVIGCGSIGSRYIRLLNQLGFDVGYYDKIKIRHLKISHNVLSYRTIEAAIDSKPNIIIIATPPNNHLSSLKSCIKSDAKILLEKPLAANKEDAKEILKISKKNKNRIWCVSNMRYHPGFKLLQQNLKDLNKVYYVNSYFSHNLSQMRKIKKKTYVENKNQGGVILDCVHDLDLITKLFGKISLVYSWISSLGIKKIKAEDYATLCFKNQKKINILFQLDFLSLYKTRGIKIVGDKGTLLWESNSKNPELVTVKLLGKNKIIKNFFNKKILHTDYVYREMLKDFMHKRKDLQTVKEAFDILNLALIARSQ